MIKIGIVGGTYLGRMNTEMYTDVFRFPLLLYRPSLSAMAIAVSVSLVAALLGSGAPTAILLGALVTLYVNLKEPGN